MATYDDAGLTYDDPTILYDDGGAGIPQPAFRFVYALGSLLSGLLRPLGTR